MSVLSPREITDSNQARASDPSVSAWVSANAGTGKTTVLVRRVLRLLLHRDPATKQYTAPESILCLTYTRAAAGEMENRLFDRLAKWAILEDAALGKELETLRDTPPEKDDLARARRLFAQTLDAKGGLNIHTIHAFCERLLRRFPLEAQVPAGFTVLEDAERVALRAASIDAVLERAAASGGPLQDALGTVVAATGEERFRDIVETVLGKQEELRAVAAAGPDPARAGEAEELALRDLLGVRKGMTEERLTSEMAAVLDDADVAQVLPVLEAGGKTDMELAERLTRAAKETEPDLRAQAFALVFLTQANKQRKRLATKAVNDEHPEVQGLLLEAAGQFYALARERSAAAIAAASGALVTLADAIILDFTARKRARAALDYDDLIARTGVLLRTSSAAQWVLYKLDYGIDHILVDEAQDTNPAQWRVIAALAAEFFAGAGAREGLRTLFAVGDEKQSIYSFQGAEPEQFSGQGRDFKVAAAAAKKSWEGVPLTVSFRSVQCVLDGVDGVFAEKPAADGVHWDGEPIAHQAAREGQAGLIEIWETVEKPEREDAPPMRPHEDDTGRADPVRTVAEQVADKIRELKDKDRLVSEDRPIRYGDILVLVPRRDPLARPLIRELKRKGIPVAGADRMKLTEQLAVMDLMALGDFVLMQEDDLALASVLKSPLFGLDDDNDLFPLARGRKTSLWEALRSRAGEKKSWAFAAKTLEGLLGSTGFVRPYEFFAGLLERDNMEMRRRLIGRLGAEAGDALDEFLALTLAHERAGPPSLQAFLGWVRGAQAVVKRDMEQGRDEVRVMTVHAAKGLEAPIVFLPDTCRYTGSGTGARLLALPRKGAPPGAPEHLVWVPAGVVPPDEIEDAKKAQKEAERREYHRQLYVAMTRARDRLYVCGWKQFKSQKEKSWYELIGEGLKGRLSKAETADGRTLWRCETPQTADHEPPRVDADAPVTPETPPAWARDPAPQEVGEAVLAPSAIHPLVEPGEDETVPAEQDVLSPAELADKARFLRGSLVHALLEHLPELPPERREAAARAYVAARGGDLPETARGEIVTETLAVLRDPAFAALFGPHSRAEVPVAARLERKDGSRLALTGQIDRLAVLDDVVWIVDYKTNRPPPEREADVAPAYVAQLAAYRAAIRKLYPEKTVRAALLWTGGPRIMELSQKRLDTVETRLLDRPPPRP